MMPYATVLYGARMFFRLKYHYDYDKIYRVNGAVTGDSRMGKLCNLIEYAKNLSKEPEAWVLAYRVRGNKTLYEGDANGFTVLRNTARYWKADPFLFTRKGKTWIFCEMYDRKRHKGVIGAAGLKRNGCSRFRICLDLPHHLSFPYVFEEGGEIYMMPECSASGEIAVYKAVKFPLKWEKAFTVAPVPGMDTVPVPGDGAVDFYLSSVERNDRLVKFRFGDDVYQTAFENAPAARCAGRIFKTDAGLIRPSQNDQGSYGNSLHFNLIEDNSFEGYRERLLLRVLPPDSLCKENEVCIGLINASNGMKYAGVHTYDHNTEFEVVDLVYYGAENRVVFWNRRKKFFAHIRKKI